jgi:hypothetical protein
MDRHPFLTVVGAEVATLLLVVAAWNLYDRRAELREWLRM